jgi:spermidine synthase
MVGSAGIIGLGTGAMAAYAGSGERWVFYEIDPDIARVAQDTNYFTYLHDTPGNVEIILGDGRLSLAAAPARKYDLLVIDAFNSDAIPIHLLTAEALSLYMSKVSQNGVVLFHLSNRYLDLEPVLGRLAQSAHLSAVIRQDTRRTRSLVESGAAPSIWAAVSFRPASLSQLRRQPEWRPLRVVRRVHLWTDDYSNIFSVYRWP